MSGTRNSNLLGKITVLLIICCCSLSAQAKYGGGSGTSNDPYLIYDANHMQAIGADANDWDKHFKLMADIDLGEFDGKEGRPVFNIIGTGFIQLGGMWPILVSTPFTGTFDGSYHKILNFTYSYTGIYIIGLFGVVDGENAEIKNLRLIDPNVAVEAHAGSLVGYLVNGTITDCYVEGGSITGDRGLGGLIGSTGSTTQISNCHATGNILGQYDIGGLIGYNGGIVSKCYSAVSVIGNAHIGGLAGHNSGTISDCNSAGDIFGVSYVGGLVANNKGRIDNCFSTASVRSDSYAVGGLVGSSSGTVFNCYATGSASGDHAVGGLFGVNWSGIVTNSYACGSVSGNTDVGGLVGKVLKYGTVTQCYSTGNVSGDDSVGGLVGETVLIATISNSYAAGYVTGNTNIGGLTGYDNSSFYTKCFWDNTVNPLLTGVGNTTDPNVIGESSANMQTKSTFIEAGWDFAGEYENGPSDDWAEPNAGGYPILWWQLSPLPVLPTFSGGTGEPNDPYLILTAAELNHIGHNQRLMGRHFRLINDIDLAGTEFFIIGNNVFPFTGTFDGNDRMISNFTYRSSNEVEAGFFACISNIHAEIKDLNLTVSCIEAQTADNVGTLVGRLEYGTISGCHADLTNVSGKRYVGGLVGFNRNGTILNCTSSGSVSGGGQGFNLGSGYVGGLVGSNSGIIYNCTSASSVISGNDDAVGGLVGRHMHIYRSDFEIRDCYTTGLVSANRWVGGLVGENMGPIRSCGSSSSVSGNNEAGGLVGYNNSTIRNCYSTGSISGITYVGGFAGRNRYKISNCYSQGGVLGNNRVGGLVGFSDKEVSNCYSVGRVTGATDVGGLVGLNDGGSVSNSFWDIDTSWQETSSGGMGKMTAEMQMMSTFTDAGWDFVGETANGTDYIWRLCEDLVGYPRLAWEFPLGDFLCPDGINFVDFSFFAEHWAEDNCAVSNDCDGRDLDQLGSVDIKDLRIFADNWLRGF